MTKCWKNGELVECSIAEFSRSLRRIAGWAEHEFRHRSDPAAMISERLNAAADQIDGLADLVDSLAHGEKASGDD